MILFQRDAIRAIWVENCQCYDKMIYFLKSMLFLHATFSCFYIFSKNFLHMTEKSTSNSFEVHIVNNIILNFSANIKLFFSICILLFCWRIIQLVKCMYLDDDWKIYAYMYFASLFKIIHSTSYFLEKVWVNCLLSKEVKHSKILYL